MLPQRRALHDGDVGADGVVHMYAWKHIGWRIGPVKGGHHAGKHILSRIQRGPEVRAIAEKGADDQADGHS